MSMIARPSNVRKRVAQLTLASMVGYAFRNPSLLAQEGIYIEPHTLASHPRPHSMLLPMLSFAKTPAK